MNVRLWVLVAAVLVALPVIIVATRNGGSSAAAPATAPGTVLGTAATLTPVTPAPDTSQGAPDATTSSSSRPTQKSRAEGRAAVPATGPGKYKTASLTAKPASSSGRMIRYRVLVEKNLNLDENAVARQVQQTLDDKRSWSGDKSVRFQLAGKGKAELTVYVVTPGTTDTLCAPLRTFGSVSCQQGRRVVLNAKRWVTGVKYYGDDLANYRRYMVNHEVGHYLGRGHVQCPGKGRRAPIMMQQTKGLDGCRPNPWVSPGR